MTNRKILYGYQFEDGLLVPVRSEAAVVYHVYTQYCAGLSYQKISDTLTRANIPYAPDCPSWNKHKIKRMLEDSRYIGRSKYPPIISADLFQTVQDTIRLKQPTKQILYPVKTTVPAPLLHTVYVPPQEALLLDKRINQVINQHMPATQVIALILQGIDARYQGIKFTGKGCADEQKYHRNPS